MSISLKMYHTDEIAESMANSLGSEEFTNMFKKAELEKQNAGDLPLDPSLDLDAPTPPMKTPADAMKGSLPKGGVPLSTKVQPKLQGEPKKAPVGTSTTHIDPVTGKPTNQGATFKADDPEQCAECDSVDQSGMSASDGEVATSPKVEAAIKFTITKLAEIADALDTNGFKDLANVIDATIANVQSK